jgi:hypothetical protein
MHPLHPFPIRGHTQQPTLNLAIVVHAFARTLFFYAVGLINSAV